MNNNDLNPTPGAQINPETKIATLLKDFPQLEETLIALSPAFGKLRNPFLRKTIAKVATLRQAVLIGNVSLGEMINTLRKSAGLNPLEDVSESVDSSSLLEPEWLKGNIPAITLDARPIIESGEHPLNQVLSGLEILGKGEIYLLITPFLPAPLIDVAKSKGFLAHSKSETEDLVKTYFISKS
jgi:hypothetical protein